MTKNATLERASQQAHTSALSTWIGKESLALNAGHRYLATTAVVILALLSGLNLVMKTNEFDQNMLDFFVNHRNPVVSVIMLALTDTFTPNDIVILAFLVALGFMFWRKSIKLGFAVLGSVGIASVIGQVLKHIVGRHRPDLAFQLVHETDLSFPSGHTTGIVALAVAIYLAARSIARKHSRRQRRRVLVVGWVLGILATLVCVSRLYVAAHWGTDVIAGVALGMGVTYFWFMVTEKLFARF